jgi:hypothetical protein
MNQLATIVGYYAPALIAAVGARPIAFSNSSPHRSGIRTPAARMRGLRENSSTDLRRRASRNLRGSRACMSQPTLSNIEPSAIRANREIAPGRPRCGTCLIGWSSSRSCRPIDQSSRRGARATPCRAARQDPGARPCRGATAFDAIDMTTVIGLRDRR